MIPRRFMRIWLDEEVPERYDALWESFRRLHPDWEFVTIDDSDEVRGWMSPAVREVFDQCVTWAGKSDVVRYVAVHRFGGVYVDADVECLKPFDELLDGPPFAAWEDPQGRRLLCPTVIGGESGHPALKALLDFLPRWALAAWVRKDGRPNLQTGPHVLTRTWKGRSDVRLLPRETFYPIGWWEREKLGGPYPPESYSVHHWDARWLVGGPGSKTIRRIEEGVPT